ncbi:hypothetical protein BCR32DRAFT_290110 [Anaeromyces robustus]|uniref:Uncharacterized protein n=1 Tax=Anaeromyces robustus TaxID=1754192 RepID=A0A1Y1XKG6_9FUNG|nr:hypothetical protein BCR32DRAFT_290110 [Anaeromyces robustus]|eukprot:ORX86251.1 hypothetical protein BCR32DRAFT_290110 [Anaeromyces robustus]
MTNNTTIENSKSKSTSLHSIAVYDQRNEPSTSYSINEDTNENNIESTVNNAISNQDINSSQDIDNQNITNNNNTVNHSRLYQFFFGKFNSKKNNRNIGKKYVKVENRSPSEIQASSQYELDEIIAEASSSNPTTVVNKLNNNLQKNVKRLINNPKPKGIVIDINTHDGVFSNLNQKPEIRSTRLPTYYEVTGNYANELDDPSIEVSIGQDIDNFGELLINDLQVGSWYSFWGTVIVSSIFEFIGFIFTFFLTSSHSAKDGSVFGLGIILFKYAIYNYPIYDIWFIILIVSIGIFLCTKGFRDYRKMKRIEKLVNSDPERYLEGRDNNSYS